MFDWRIIFVFDLRYLLVLLLNFSLSFATNLAFSIPDCRYQKVDKRKTEVNQDRYKQETGEDPGDLQLQIRKQRWVVNYLGVEVVGEHEGEVEID